MLKRKVRVLLIAALVAAAPAEAGRAVLLFDELSPRSFGEIALPGITLTFTGGTATYNSSPFAGIPTNYLSEPVLEGPTSGTLVLDFHNPTDFLQFGFALASTDFITEAVSVALSVRGSPIGTLSAAAEPLLSFSEGQFTYTGIPLTRAAIRFTTQVEAFALDNLAYEVPEPPTLALYAGAALVLFALRGVLRLL